MLRYLVRLTLTLLGWILSRVLRAAFFLSATSTASLIVGVPTAVERLADFWIESATSAGVPIAYYQQLRQGAVVLAWLVLVLGWLTLTILIFLVLALVF